MKKRPSEEQPVSDPRVLAAMRKVPRHLFVPEAERPRAYDDSALPIPCGQTISQPYMVGRMTELLALSPGSRVLEIGTGSGYQTAVLAELAGEVFTTEILAPLARQAEAALLELGYSNIRFRLGDGALGWPDAAPFDAIIVTCAPERIPPALLEQLRPGGRLCIPLGPVEGDQDLYLVTKLADGSFKTEKILPVRFVPLTGGADHWG